MSIAAIANRTTVFMLVRLDLAYRAEQDRLSHLMDPMISRLRDRSFGAIQIGQCECHYCQKYRREASR
jgi:hypothetical protein